MISRRITPNRSGRRFITALAAAGLLGGILLSSGTALAVHDTGAFQLDGNPSTADDSTPSNAEDWDAICKAHPTTCTKNSDFDFTNVPTTTAFRSAFITDAFLSASDNIYKGGTDDADVNTWQWKQAGPSPDKDDIEHAFAAEYNITAAGPYQNHKVLFFGGDRLANNGNTNIGLWFFQNPVSTAGNKTTTDQNTGVVSCSFNSGCGFSGTHKVGNKSLGGNIAGDLFILSAFTNGGAQPTIKVFEWVGPGNATKNYLGSNGCFTSACTLQPLAIPLTPGFTDNRCDGSDVTADVACAIVNPGGEITPWTFTDKTSGAPLNTHGASELYEGGLDLTGLGFGEACFSTVLLNSRSSQSGTSVLQDFAIGSFGSCTSGVDTTPSVGSDATVTPGTSVRDNATITVTGYSGAFAGTMSFYLCGPTPLADASYTLCSTGGTIVNGSETGALNAPVAVTGNAGTASVQSSAYTVNDPGRYCWRGVYSGDASKSVPGSSDSTVDECFKVAKINTTTVTTPGTVTSGTFTAGNSFVLGTTIYDRAVVTGTSVGDDPTGQVNFFVCTPAQLTPANTGVCAAGSGSAVTGNPKDLVSDGNPATYTSSALSGAYTPSTIGRYCFRASYGGNTVYNASDDTGSTGECVTITDTTSVTSAQKWLPNDSATVSSGGGSTPINGTLSFTLYSGLTCGVGGGSVLRTAETFTLTNATTLADRTKATTNGTNNTYEALATQNVSWLVTFTPATGSNLSGNSTCETSQLTVTN
jgi:hypothetical protein